MVQSGRAVTFVLMVVALAATGAWGAGGRTHREGGARGWEKYLRQPGPGFDGLAELLDEPETAHAYLSGCIFPDWGYLNVNRDASEASHWGAFLVGYQQYLKETCPPPWDAQARKRIAFFLGVVTHGVTDIPWHFTHGEHRALERKGDEMGDAGNYDMACHIINQHDLGSLPHMNGLTFCPVDDVLAVFDRTGIHATPPELELGIKHLTGATLFTTHFGNFLYQKSLEQVPWAGAHYIDYYYGGVEHMAALTAMWMRWHYSRLSDQYFFQSTPEYGIQPPNYVPYLGCADAVIDADAPLDNSGAEPFLEVRGGRDERRTLLRFDISEVPAGAAVAEACLWLYVMAGHEGDAVEVCAVNKPWQEGAGVTSPINGCNGRTALAEEVTWKNTGRDGVVWTSPGGDVDSRAACTLQLETTAPEGDWVSCNITALVRRWIDSPETNCGMLLKAAGSSVSARFLSSEAFQSNTTGYCGATRIAYRPALTLKGCAAR